MLVKRPTRLLYEPPTQTARPSTYVAEWSQGCLRSKKPGIPTLRASISSI